MNGKTQWFQSMVRTSGIDLVIVTVGANFQFKYLERRSPRSSSQALCTHVRRSVIRQTRFNVCFHSRVVRRKRKLRETVGTPPKSRRHCVNISTAQERAKPDFYWARWDFFWNDFCWILTLCSCWHAWLQSIYVRYSDVSAPRSPKNNTSLPHSCTRYLPNNDHLRIVCRPRVKPFLDIILCFTVSPVSLHPDEKPQWQEIKVLTCFAEIPCDVIVQTWKG